MMLETAGPALVALVHVAGDRVGGRIVAEEERRRRDRPSAPDRVLPQERAVAEGLRSAGDVTNRSRPDRAEFRPGRPQDAALSRLPHRETHRQLSAVVDALVPAHSDL